MRVLPHAVRRLQWTNSVGQSDNDRLSRIGSLSRRQAGGAATSVCTVLSGTPIQPDTGYEFPTLNRRRGLPSITWKWASLTLLASCFASPPPHTGRSLKRYGGRARSISSSRARPRKFATLPEVLPCSKGAPPLFR